MIFYQSARGYKKDTKTRNEKTKKTAERACSSITNIIMLPRWSYASLPWHSGHIPPCHGTPDTSLPTIALRTHASLLPHSGHIPPDHGTPDTSLPAIALRTHPYPVSSVCFDRGKVALFGQPLYRLRNYPISTIAPFVITINHCIVCYYNQPSHSFVFTISTIAFVCYYNLNHYCMFRYSISTIAFVRYYNLNHCIRFVAGLCRGDCLSSYLPTT